jgi:hypothetical protein
MRNLFNFNIKQTIEMLIGEHKLEISLLGFLYKSDFASMYDFLSCLEHLFPIFVRFGAIYR